MATLLETLHTRVLVGDGAMGTLLRARGVPEAACLEEITLSRPELVTQIHDEYLAAGANIIETNTFAASRPRLERYGLEGRIAEINWNAAQLAKASAKKQGAFVAGSVGPIALRPSDAAQWTGSDIENFFREQIGPLLDGGVDALFLETFADLQELRHALYVFRSLDSRPVLCSLACAEDGRMSGGETVEEAFAILKEEGATMLGFNATLGPRATLELFKRLPIDPDIPYAAFPHAGKPQFLDGHYLYHATASYFGETAQAIAEEGVSLIGGCIGTEPAHVKAIAEALQGREPVRSKAVRVRINREPAQKSEVEPAGESILDLWKRKTVSIVELDTPKSLAMTKFMEGARALQKAGADAVTLADNSLAILRVGNFAAGQLLQQEGIRPLLHMACRDRNLIGTQSELMGLATLGLNHVLAITGDPAKVGDHPGATSVYDVNSIGLISIMAGMNRGQSQMGRDLKRSTAFVIGCSFNPNARNFDMQVRKLESKLKAGAQYVMTQPVFDAALVARTHEALTPLGIPVFVGVMPLFGSRNTEFLHNEVPGISIPDPVRERMRGLEGEEGSREGLHIAHEIQTEVLSRFNGVYLITPLLRYEMSVELLSRR